VQLVVRDDGLAAACELSSYALKHNFGDTLRRYAEHYHARIEHIAHADHSGQHEHSGDGIASAHDIVRCKHPIDASDVAPDAQPRVIGLDRIDGQTITDYVAQDAADTQSLAFARDGVVKTWRLDAGTLELSWHCRGLAGRTLAIELNLAMPSCDGYAGRYRLADGSIPGGFGQAFADAAATRVFLEDGVLGGSMRLSCSPPADFRGRPHFTVSQSEAGFEKIMQAVEMTIGWAITRDDESFTLQVELNDQG
jgi:alpha-amylase